MVQKRVVEATWARVHKIQAKVPTQLTWGHRLVSMAYSEMDTLTIQSGEPGLTLDSSGRMSDSNFLMAYACVRALCV